MKLVTAIVHNEDAATLVDALLEKEYRATRFNSSGGFLKQGNATIILGVEDDKPIFDFNFAYNPSCSYDPRWACPLAPPDNRLALEIRAGERYG